MKVLILSVTTGQGHNQTAKAIIKALEQQNIECILLDTYEYINPVLSESIDKGYLISTKFTPAVYGKIYKAAENRNKKYVSFPMLMSSLLSKKLVSFLEAYNADVIICTHIFAAQILTYLMQKGFYTKSIGIVTDFTVHPYWEETNLDYYITASESLNNQMKKKGIPLEKVKPFGIPIDLKFAKKRSVSEARKILGFDDKTTVFVMSGSMGYGNVAQSIQQLDQLPGDFQIVSVCGHNSSTKKKIDKLNINKRLYSFGFTDNIDIIMDASSCIVTKPGGLTVSESLAKELPMILVNPIPGQEDRNVDFLINNGLAVKVSNTYPLDEAIYQLMLSEAHMKYYKDMISLFRKPYATRDLVDLIKNM